MKCDCILGAIFIRRLAKRYSEEDKRHLCPLTKVLFHIRYDFENAKRNTYLYRRAI